MVKVRLPVLLAVFIGIFAMASSPAMAFKNFVAKPGKGSIKGKGLAPSVFKTGENPTVECAEVTAKATVTAEKFTTSEQEAKYEKCKVGGFIEVTISPVKYVVTAAGGAKLNNTVTVKAVACELTIAGGQSFEKGVSYSNNGNNYININIFAGVAYVGKGLTCPNKGTNGEYKDDEEYLGNNPPESINLE